MEAYAEAKTRETECDESAPTLDDGDKVGNGAAKKNVGDANDTDEEETTETDDKNGNTNDNKEQDNANQEEPSENDKNDGNNNYAITSPRNSTSANAAKATKIR